MLREQGEVRRIEGRVALVALRSHGGCGSCSSSSSQGGSCQSGGGGGGGDADEDRLVTVAISLPVKAGDRVELAVPATQQGGQLLTQGVFLAVPALLAGALFERLVQRLTGVAAEPVFLLAVAAAGAVVGQWLWRWRSARQAPRLVKILPKSLPMLG